MATPINSPEDFEQKLSTDSLGGATVQISSPPSGADSSFGASPVTATSGVGVNTPTPNLQQGAGESLGYSQPGSSYSGLFSPLSQGLETAQQELGGSIQSFWDNPAVQPQNYKSLGGNKALWSYVSQGENQPLAQRMAGAEYSGPEGLTYEPSVSLSDLQARTNALASGSGLTALMQSSNPRLTPGMARFDAQQAWYDPSFKQQAKGYQSQVDKFFKDLTLQQEKAEARAAERVGEEKEIKEKSKNYLQSLGEQIYGNLGAEVEAKKAQQQQTQDVYAGLRGEPGGTGPTQEQLQAAGLGEMWTQYSQEQQAAQEAKARINEKYKDIADIPDMRMGITDTGREGFIFDYKGKSYIYNRALAGRYGEEAQKVAERVGQRYSENMRLFNPGTWYTESHYPDRPLGEHYLYEPYQYRDVLNQPSAQMPNIAQFIGLDPGVRPTRENVATEEQRARLGRINEMIDTIPMLEEANMPFQAARISGDIEGLLAAQEKALEARGELLGEARDKWVTDVRKARNRYEKAKEDAIWGGIAQIVAGSVPGLQSLWVSGAKDLSNAGI